MIASDGGVLWIDQLLPFHRSANVAWPLLSLYDPTAVQTLADGHDTPLSWMLTAPVGLGVPWIDHLEPFQRTANPPLGPDPTAVQALADTHDTALRTPPFVAAVCGVRRIDHFEPLQRSTKIPPGSDPTAMHTRVDVHETLFSWLPAAPVRVGVLCTDHLEPFQPSASIARVPARFVPDPTAMQAVADAQETSSSSLAVDQLGRGVPWTVQPAPFHCCANVT